MDSYKDIIDLPHYVSEKRPPMSMIDRGAQFSPFAALTGYEAVIAESSRLTETGTELTEGAVEALDRILQELCGHLEQQPWARYTCFQPDQRKTGGAYVEIAGRLKKYDSLQKTLLLTDGTRIPVESIVSIETE